MDTWEYLFLSAYPAGGTHKVTRLNGDTLANWQEGPSVYEYIEQMGGEGWEMVSATYLPFMGNIELAHHYTFKRPRASAAGGQTTRLESGRTQRL